MTSDPVFLLLVTGLSAWMARWWAIDYRAGLAGTRHGGSLPGATPASGPALAIASLGALLILAVETAVEHALGLSGQQSTMTALLALYSMLGAPVMEEVLFRGYLVIDGRGPVLLWAGVVGGSVLFALAHPFLWQWSGAGLTFDLGAKACVSTLAIFALSLWLYVVRFFRLNPRRSLLPCFVAHAARNLGVVAVKYVQGAVGGWW